MDSPKAFSICSRVSPRAPFAVIAMALSTDMGDIIIFPLPGAFSRNRRRAKSAAAASSFSSGCTFAASGRASIFFIRSSSDALLEAAGEPQPVNAAIASAALTASAMIRFFISVPPHIIRPAKPRRAVCNFAVC